MTSLVPDGRRFAADALEKPYGQLVLFDVRLTARVVELERRMNHGSGGSSFPSSPDVLG
ncbi:hypothetical protein [Streptomyces avicenniae]|uniref:hypothetical protein n=1 Tax=Streptomyces avicenniae TaxID=500153 RepID=UPI000AE31CC7|nr:hypothetical protein [Streptomyces avicenniae]